LDHLLTCPSLFQTYSLISTVLPTTLSTPLFFIFFIYPLRTLIISFNFCQLKMYDEEKLTPQQKAAITRAANKKARQALALQTSMDIDPVSNIAPRAAKAKALADPGDDFSW
jgi:hypothetical protein